MIDGYSWPGGQEAMLRFGPAGAATVAMAPPLFEEHNRVRALVARLCRLLAARGIASVLPDLPGQGESLMPLDIVPLADMRAAFAAAVASSGAQFGVAIRSGALLDEAATLAARWHLAPQTGAALLREGARARLAAGEADATVVAGNRLSAAMLDDLTGAEPLAGDGVRVVRLADDPATADARVPGAPLWRRAEPGDDRALAALLADDIAGWIERCGG